jgi:uncharacterized membrane protein YdjX (TVP38/TMEM64 family)
MTPAELPSAAPATSQIRRWLPVAVLLGLIAAAYASGLSRHVSLSAVAENRDALRDFVASHRIAAVLLYMVVYISAVGLSFPGASLISVAGGFLFGWMISVPATVTAATLGGLIIFQIVKTSFGAALAQRAGPFVRKLSAGFAADAFSYLLFLRLTPVFPFFIVNAVAGLCNIRASTFALATIIGIVPAAFAFAWLGMGLDSLIDAQLASHQACVALRGAASCTFSFDSSALLTTDILVAFAGLGVVALIPIAIRRWISR